MQYAAACVKLTHGIAPVLLSSSTSRISELGSVLVALSFLEFLTPSREWARYSPFSTTRFTGVLTFHNG
mgnify:CR=1 FL=1